MFTPVNIRPQLGAFADLVFEVSSLRTLTFDRFKRDTKARFAKHELINQTTVLEYLGRDLEQITFSMKFNRQLNVDPRVETRKIRQLCADGIADYLIIGNQVIGDNLWVIESTGEAVEFWDNRGQILVSTVEVKMSEYIAGVDLP